MLKPIVQEEEKKVETAASRLERREQLKKSNTLPTSVTGTLVLLFCDDHSHSVISENFAQFSAHLWWLTPVTHSELLHCWHNLTSACQCSDGMRCQQAAMGLCISSGKG